MKSKEASGSVQTADPRQLAQQVASVADDKKASHIVIYHVTDLIGITDYFVVCSADNAPQIKAIAKEVARVAKQAGLPVYSTEGSAESGWVLTDFSDVVLHVFNHETREYYDFDLLWGDAPRVDWTPADRRTPPK